MMNKQADPSFYKWLESDWQGSDSGPLTPEPALGTPPEPHVT